MYLNGLTILNKFKNLICCVPKILQVLVNHLNGLITELEVSTQLFAYTLSVSINDLRTVNNTF